MNTWIRRTLQVGLVAGGFVLVGAVAAHADDATSIGNSGIGNGNQLIAPIQLPVNVCGNGVGAAIGFGSGSGACATEANLKSSALGDLTSVGNSGILNGNQAQVPVQAPINGVGNGVGVAGIGTGSGAGKAQANLKKASTKAGPDLTSVGNSGVGNGNQAYVPIQVPINAVGNGVGVLGVGTGSGVGASQANMKAASALPDLTSIGNSGVGNGNQIAAPIQVPVNACGNGVGAAIGLGTGSGLCSTEANNGGTNGSGYKTYSFKKTSALPDATSIGNSGVGNGNQLIAPIQVPVNVVGNGVGVLGIGTGSGAGKSQANLKAASMKAGPDLTSIGNSGILNGNQAYVPIQVPVNVCGNGVGVLGVGTGSGACKSDANLKASNSPDLTSVGNSGILNGNQAYVPIQVPVNVVGNGVGVLGLGTGSGVGSTTANNG